VQIPDEKKPRKSKSRMVRVRRKKAIAEAFRNSNLMSPGAGGSRALGSMQQDIQEETKHEQKQTAGHIDVGDDLKIEDFEFD